MRIKRRIVLLVLVGFVLFGACRKQPVNQQTGNSNSSRTPEAPVGGTAPAGENFYLRGTIGDNLAIEINLVRDGERLNGTYFYPKVGKNIALNGTIDKGGNVELKESDESGKQTGTFKGQWKSATGSPDPSLNQIEGKWSKPDGSKETAFQVVQQPIEFTAAVRVTPKVIKEANKEKRYTIDAEYPQVEGDPRFDGFNREARSLITKDVAAFKTERNSEENVPGLTESQVSTMDVRYEIRCATDDLISIEFTEASYAWGAAHGNSLTTVINYDLKNGKKLALADLFNPKSNYLGTISAYCINELKARSKKEKDPMFGDEDTIQMGASPRADNYRGLVDHEKRFVDYFRSVSGSGVRRRPAERSGAVFDNEGDHQT